MNLLKQNQIAEVKMTYSSKMNIKNAPEIKGSKAAYEIFLQGWVDIEYVEHFKILLLNRANKVKGIILIAIGGTCGCVVDTKIILQAALLSNSCGVLLAHNHPSGNISPSDADRKITRKIQDACRLMEISLLDHIIITTSGYFSFADEGML